MQALHDMFWSKVPDQPGLDCWEWSGGRNARGYGVLNHRVDGISKKTPIALAHRVSYLLCVGDPQGLFVCHACDNPPCVNPSHLFLGTQTDNMRDANRKGRINVLKTHCKYGHPYDDINTGIRKSARKSSGGRDGYRRYCRECNRLTGLHWYHQRKVQS